jgi:hypothetical protein
MSGYDQDYSNAPWIPDNANVGQGAGSAGINWGGLTDALAAANKQNQTAQQNQPKPLSVAGGTAQATPGTPRSPVNLANLVQMMDARRNAYMNAAMGGPNAATARPTGLLGY